MSDRDPANLRQKTRFYPSAFSGKCFLEYIVGLRLCVFDLGSWLVRPDYVIRLSDGSHLILEVKGQPSQQDRSKELALEDGVTAVNNDKRFGKWTRATSTHPKDIPYIIEKVLKGLPIPNSDLTSYKT